jgi:hypothetical protein
MFKRLFILTVGIGAGLAIGVWAVRKVEDTSRKLRPESLAAGAADRAGSFGARVRMAMAEGRAAAAAREVELRGVYGVGTADRPPVA